MSMRAKTSILMALITVLTLGITGIFHLGNFRDSLRNSVFEGLQTVSGTGSQLISRFLTDTLRETEMIAVSLSKEAMEKRDISALEERLKLYSEKLSKFENGMFLLDRSGILWVDYPPHPELRGKSFAFREYFTRTMEEGRGIIGKPYRSARTDTPVLTFTAPLHSTSGEMIGLLGCSVQLNSLNALEGIRLARIGETGYIYVYDRQRLMILHPDHERILVKDVPVGTNKLFDAAIEGFEGVGETVNSKGVPMLISLKQIPGTDWILGAQQTAAEAFTPLRAAQNRILAGIILAAMVAACLAALTITGITRPLLRLRKAVMFFGKTGEARDGGPGKAYRRELEGIARKGEIGDLTRAFQSISEQLERSIGSLKKSARDWERTFNSVSDAILIVDPGIRVARLNESAKAALDAKYTDVIGKPLLTLLGQARITDHSPLSDENEPAEQTFLMELVKEGLTHTLEVTMTPLFQESERVGTVVVAKDITSKVQAEAERKILHAQLQQAQKMEAIGTLAGGIAHNFNNLLMGIQGNISLILMSTDPGHPHYPKAKNVEKMVQSGSRLTSQLLGYAREGRFQIRPISINRVLKETSETFAPARKDIRVHQELAGNLWAVQADQGQIEQVLMNLFVNAADAMPNGGTLYLRTENTSHKKFSHKLFKVKPGNYVLLSVRDTGTGMDRKTLERIFDPFFTTKGIGRGTGLGLASVYGIVKAHDGYVDVESESGRGSNFTIYLPASRETMPSDKDGPSFFTRGNEKVLLVDDEEMILDVGQKILGAIGYDVSLAKSGEEAISIYRSQSGEIDLVLLDMVMPVMCGGETYDCLKKINPDVKVLLSSGYSIDGQAAEIMKRGCNGFIQKPFNIEQLSHKIRDVLGQSTQESLS